MRVGYLDTSVLIAVAFHDPGGAFVARALRSFDRLYSSTLLESEFMAAAKREGCLQEVSGYLAPVRFVHPQGAMSEQIGRVLGQGDAGGAELHHLACALYLFPDPKEAFFLSVIEEQTGLAARVGFRTEFL